MNIKMAAKATMLVGAQKLLSPELQPLIQAHHEALAEACDGPGEQVAVMMLDAVSVAIGSAKDGSKEQIRELLKIMIDELFDTDTETLRPKSAVIH